jgi:hypothetical protein
MQVQSAIHAGLTNIAINAGALDPLKPVRRVLVESLVALGVVPLVKPLDSGFTPWNPPPVAVNNECLPGDISDADLVTADPEQLVYQLSQQSGDTQFTSIPSTF